MAPKADHTITAFTVDETCSYVNDGYFGSSVKVIDMLEERKLRNVVIFVTCISGGIPLGSERFKIIRGNIKQNGH